MKKKKEAKEANPKKRKAIKEVTEGLNPEQRKRYQELLKGIKIISTKDVENIPDVGKEEEE